MKVLKIHKLYGVVLVVDSYPEEEGDSVGRVPGLCMEGNEVFETTNHQKALKYIAAMNEDYPLNVYRIATITWDA